MGFITLEDDESKCSPIQPRNPIPPKDEPVSIIGEKEEKVDNGV